MSRACGKSLKSPFLKAWISITYHNLTVSKWTKSNPLIWMIWKKRAMNSQRILTRNTLWNSINSFSKERTAQQHSAQEWLKTCEITKRQQKQAEISHLCLILTPKKNTRKKKLWADKKACSKAVKKSNSKRLSNLLEHFKIIVLNYFKNSLKMLFNVLNNIKNY